MPQRRLFTCLLVVLSITAPSIAADDEAALILENGVIEARKSMKRGELRVQVTNTRTKGNPRKYTLGYHIHFDGDKLRSDLKTMTFDQDSKVTKERTGKYVMTPGGFIHHSDDLSSNGKRLAVVMGDADQAGNFQKEMVNPKLIGMIPCDFHALHAMKINEVLGRTDRQNVSVSDDVVDEETCKKISFNSLDDSVSVDLWIAVDKPVLVRASGVVAINGQNVHDEINVTAEEFPYADRKVWFPTKVLYERSVDDQTLMSETAEIEVVSLGEPIEADTFFLAGMNIPAGTSIRESPQKSPRVTYWDGKQIAVRRIAASRPASLDPPPSTRRARLLLISVNLILIAGLLLFLWWKSNQGQSSASDTQDSAK